MSFEKQAMLVSRLLQKTLEGALEWKSSVGDESFQISFRNYSVRLTMMPRSGDEDYVVELFNEQGDVADSFTDVDLRGTPGAPIEGSWFKTMRDLFSRARRSALGADKAVDAILKEIDETNF